MPTDQERLIMLEAHDAEHTKNIHEMGKDIKEIKEKLLLRPSWSVSVIITLLSSTCASLLVYIATIHR